MQESVLSMNYQYDALMGNEIKKLREERSLTQSQLVAKLQVQGCDLTRSALAKIEVGQRHIYSREIKSIKNALNVEYDKLFK